MIFPFFKDCEDKKKINVRCNLLAEFLVLHENYKTK
jgi:hypothetical protein